LVWTARFWIAKFWIARPALTLGVFASELIEVPFGLREVIVLDEVAVEVVIVVVTELVIIEIVVVAELIVVFDLFFTDLDVVVAEDVELFVPVALLALHVHPS
jgi:hypothetical protein